MNFCKVLQATDGVEKVGLNQMRIERMRMHIGAGILVSFELEKRLSKLADHFSVLRNRQTAGWKTESDGRLLKTVTLSRCLGNPDELADLHSWMMRFPNDPFAKIRNANSI